MELINSARNIPPQRLYVSVRVAISIITRLKPIEMYPIRILIQAELNSNAYTLVGYHLK